jgi:hypothetical protein
MTHFGEGGEGEEEERSMQVASFDEGIQMVMTEESKYAGPKITCANLPSS